MSLAPRTMDTTMEEELPIRIVKSVYTVSCFDISDGHWFHHYQIRVEERSKDQWAVLDPLGDTLSDKGEWDYEPQPSSRTDAWLKSHRFDLEAAMLWAHKVLPFIEVNGVTTVEAWRRKRERDGIQDQEGS